jgi:hypothetical protein
MTARFLVPAGLNVYRNEGLEETSSLQRSEIFSLLRYTLRSYRALEILSALAIDIWPRCGQAPDFVSEL